MPPAGEGMVPPAGEGMVPPAGEGVIPPPHREHVRKDMRPPLILGEHDAVAVIILILMLGMNLGVKLYFRQLKDRERMAKLKKQSLEQQLEYLRYQISPHFLMNTLNNIHALVDIDSEQAKDSIVSLSQIMRFALYEGSKQTVPLSSELAFTRQYIQLMRMRVSQRVRIDIDLPSTVPDAQIPPLMLITFVENAFKHGVSYRQESFIEVSATVVDGTLSFRCRNSKAPKEKESPGGVGLSNVKRRLELIYGKNYSLDIKDLTETYNIELTLPL
jgi:LytS/YehU family sensor histidine kinase